MTHVPLLSQGAKECGDNYPIVNHTVRVKELLSSRIDIDQPAILYSVSLTAKEFPGLATDMKYTAYIIACTSITCHQSDGVEICKCVITFFSAPILFLFTFYSLFCLSSTSSLCLFIVLPIPLHSFSHMHLSPPILFSLLPPQIIVITFQPSYVLPCFPLPLYPVLSISSLPSRHVKHPVSHSHLYPHKRVPQLYSNHWKCCHWLPLHLFFGQHNTVFQYLTK